MAEAYGELAQLQALLGLPVAIGVALTVPDLVQALLGPAWAGTAEAARVAGISAAAFFAMGSYGSLFVAIGRPKWNLYISVGSVAIQFGALAILRPTTPEGIAAVWAIPALILPPVILATVLRQLDRDLWWLAKRILPAALSTGAMTAAVLSTQAALDTSPILKLLASALSGAAAFALVAWLSLGRRLPVALTWKASPAAEMAG
jgi:O-antigen/teichoic acid export membrane protein